MSNKKLSKTLSSKIKVPAPPPPNLDILWNPEAKIDLRRDMERRAQYREEIKKLTRQERQKKMAELLRYFAIDKFDPNKWELLAWALASRLTGFQTVERKNRGRKKVWDDDLLNKLHSDVRQIQHSLRKQKTSGSVHSACVVLAKREPWKSKKLTAKTLATTITIMLQYA
jgi:hypothetical protein